MKVSRVDLKEVVRECLLELLSEGIGPIGGAAAPRMKECAARRPQLSASRPAQRPAQPRQPQQSDELREAIKRNAGGDPVLAGILADTARTTLPAMIQGDRAGAVEGDAAQRTVARLAPEQMFDSETTDKWASLAFMKTRPGQSVGLPPDDGDS